jgi:hypothetical protein
MTNSILGISNVTTPVKSRIVVQKSKTPTKPLARGVLENANIRSPNGTHYADNLTQRDVDYIDKFKPIQTLILGQSPMTKDIPKIIRGEIQPDENGVATVTLSNGKKRRWKLHPENAPNGINRLIPLDGRNIVPIPGNLMKRVFSDFQKSRDTLPSEYIRKNVVVVDPAKKQKTAAPLNTPKIGASASFQTVATVAPTATLTSRVSFSLKTPR